MKKKTFYAMAIAVLLPLVSYLLVDHYSKEALVMPRHYFYDSVATKTVDGKLVSDTIWHRIPDFTFTNQLGKQVSLSDFKGKIVVVDFFFTHCPSICPTLTRSMRMLQDAYQKNDTIVRFISFTVDPERDSAEQLKRYADRFGVDHDVWWMLTGKKKKIYDLALDEFKASVVDGEGADSLFIHTDKFWLLDKHRMIRGFYSGLDSAQMLKLTEDISLLLLERDKSEKRSLFRK